MNLYVENMFLKIVVLPAFCKIFVHCAFAVNQSVYQTPSMWTIQIGWSKVHAQPLGVALYPSAGSHYLDSIHILYFQYTPGLLVSLCHHISIPQLLIVQQITLSDH